VRKSQARILALCNRVQSRLTGSVREFVKVEPEPCFGPLFCPFLSASYLQADARDKKYQC
jgi:hypothetical protein